jgi:hypothetical protein
MRAAKPSTIQKPQFAGCSRTFISSVGMKKERKSKMTQRVKPARSKQPETGENGK